MNLKISNKTAYKIEILGMVLFTIFFALAMATYAGGTRDNPSNPGYSFWFNTISDTGRTVAHNGKSNIIALIFFSIAMSIIAIAIIPFYMVLPRLFDEDSRDKSFMKIGGYFGILSSISLIGVVFTPADILSPPHALFALMNFFFGLCRLILYSIALYRNKNFSNIYAYICMVVMAVSFLSMAIGIYGLTIGIRAFSTIGQKIGTIVGLLSFLALTYGAWKLENN